jgi:tetratricopeptide (TPR) repeat protein
MIRRLALVGSLWLALAAATPLPVKPPPPDLTPLVPWATAPLAKPAVEVPRLTPPPPPLSIAPVSPATVVIPAAPKPMAPMLSPRAMPCVGAWLRIASESLECARARIVRGEYEEAARALDNALRAGGDREILAEARYWFGEVLYLLGDFGRADWALQQALKDLAVPEYGPWARHASGWTSLRLGDFRRAEANFQALLGKPHPVPLDTWGRHGLALALYAQARWEDAEKAWSALLGRRVPVVLERDLAFWHGEALARTGQTERAVAKLQAFTQSGPHALLPAGQVRLGWLYLGQNRTTDAQAMFRAFLAGSGDARGDREWAEAGLALALVNGGDSAGPGGRWLPSTRVAPRWPCPSGSAWRPWPRRRAGTPRRWPRSRRCWRGTSHRPSGPGCSSCRGTCTVPRTSTTRHGHSSIWLARPSRAARRRTTPRSGWPTPTSSCGSSPRPRWTCGRSCSR